MKYYCIGIKGAGMSSLAQILYDLGNDVIGYDDNKEYKYTQKGLDERGIKIYYESHELDKDTIVTFSKAFSEDHEEIVRLKNSGFTIKKYNEIMGDLTKQFYSICVSGTHGKTTTSNIIRYLLEDSVGCNYFVGSGFGYAKKDNKYFVIESDEYNRHFLAYWPKEVIITNIELEHTECYKDLEDIENTFLEFANKAEEKIYVCGDYPNIRKLNFKKNVIYYGENENNDVVCKNIVLDTAGCSFDMYVKNEFIRNFRLPLYGKHMVLDALIAIYVSLEKGIDKDKIYEKLLNFLNTSRRFVVENYKGSIIVDDYAHHPTEIKATIESCRQKFPNKKLTVVFVPNTYSRTKDLCDDFVKVLSLADNVYVSEILSDREKSEDYPLVTSKIITDKIASSKIIGVDNINLLDKSFDDVVCFVGCAKTSHLIKAYKERIDSLR